MSANVCPHGYTGPCSQCSGSVTGDPQCPHGNFLGSFCNDCASERLRRMECRAAPTSDARAQLWARVYAAEFSACRHGTLLDKRDALETANDALALKRARALADAAVRDFDEHYLGGKQ